MSPKAFSLLEIMVAIAIFTLVIVGAGGTFLPIQQAWQRQRQTIDLIQNVRWAMEFMVNEIRGGGNFTVVSGDSVQLELPPGGAPNRVWYWRGDDGTYGSRNTLFRGTGAGLGNANNNRQELANLIVDNPSGNNIFIDAGGNLYTIELTVRPKPTEPESSGNRSYTSRTQARPRN